LRFAFRLSANILIKTMRNLLALAALAAGLETLQGAVPPPVTVDGLRCESQANPLGLDTPQPRLSWQLQSSQRAQTQTGYQVLVASSREKLAANMGDLWDTGRLDSDQSIQVEYQGRPLRSAQTCFWKVRIWDKDGNLSRFSDPASWEMGLLEATDWRGHWIARDTDTNEAAAPLLRRAFRLDSPVAQARVYICGLGYYELHINGKKIGDHALDPGFTRYDKRALYVTYDVTQALHQGSNAIAVILGNGWHNVQTRAFWGFDRAPWRAAPKLLMELRLRLADGRTAVVPSDERWKTSRAPITTNSLYSGESYDARLEQPGWDTPNFDDANWTPAQIVSAPQGRLAAQTMPAIKITGTLNPVQISQPKPGLSVYDFGQNFAGFARLTVAGPAGTRITMKYGERLAADGTVDQTAIARYVVALDPSQEFQTDHYTLGGHGTESWQPRFVYHGFQYVEVTGAPGPLTLTNLAGCFVHSDVAEAGRFSSSDHTIDRIWTAGRWSYLSNLEGLPTDCPHREKNGWMGDAHLAAEQGLLNYDAAGVYEKWIVDIADEQRPDSRQVPGLAPTSGWGFPWGNGPAWDSAFLLVPYYLYEYRGDTRALTSHYPALREYVDSLERGSKDDIIDWGRNDWDSAGSDTPADITSTAYFYQDALIVAKAAELLGRRDEARKYQALAARVKSAFNRKFFHPDTGSYGNGSQTSLSCALYQGLVEEPFRAAVTSNLAARVRQSDNHIDTGILGAKYLPAALTENGRADLAWDIVTQRTAPGWGGWMESGANTLWEQWDGSGSHNHIAFGDILAWFDKALAGLNPDPEFPGFKHTIFKPHVVGNLRWVKASYDSMYGPIQCAWAIKNGRFTYEVSIPPNTTATVYLPGNGEGVVEEGGHPVIGGVGGVGGIETQGECTVLDIGSGSYSFSVPWVLNK
jgi:alpha-L-rhamnosidase